MSLVIPDGCANWTLTIINGGAGLSSRSSISLGTTLLSPLDQTIVNRVANLLRDNLKTLYDSVWQLGPVHCIENDSGVLLAHDDTTVEAGTHTADTYAPPAVACVVSKRTGVAARWARGRFYLPGVPAGFIGDDGQINPTHTANVQAAVNALQTAFEADAAINQLALFHDDTSPATGDFTPILSLVPRTVSGVMRPRQRR